MNSCYTILIIPNSNSFTVYIQLITCYYCRKKKRFSFKTFMYTIFLYCTLTINTYVFTCLRLEFNKTTKLRPFVKIKQFFPYIFVTLFNRFMSFIVCSILYQCSLLLTYIILKFFISKKRLIIFYT